MASPKINNVRVHVWTKSELNKTVKQCKEAGFEVEKANEMVKIYNGDYCFLQALIGFPAGAVTIRLDATYFSY